MTGSGRPDPSAAVRFNDNINARDIDGLARLMSDDHTFIDSAGTVIAGKKACLEAWRGFFESYPDYRNVFASVTAHRDAVAIVGHSACSEPSLAGPALWRAKVEDGLVVEWRVYEDIPENRRLLSIGPDR